MEMNFYDPKLIEEKCAEKPSENTRSLISLFVWVGGLFCTGTFVYSELWNDLEGVFARCFCVLLFPWLCCNISAEGLVV